MSDRSATAELIPDSGEAVSGSEFFRSRPFLDAEGVTHTLRIAAEDVELLAPLVVRDVPAGGGRDAVSPYGYPGLARIRGLSRIEGQASDTDEHQLDPSRIDFSATGLVSIFLRHTLGPSPLAGSRPRNLVQLADPELPPKSRMSDRQQIRKNLRRGYRLDLVPGVETTPSQRAGFLVAYEQTMRRATAAEHYFFGAAYFDRILEAHHTWLALALAPDGEVAAASIAAVSDGFLHYYLSGSADSHLRDSPMKNIVACLVEHAAELGLPLNLGGGIAAGDALEEFKRGFANREQPWSTSEIVCDPASYARLSGDREAGEFFPAYRGG